MRIVQFFLNLSWSACAQLVIASFIAGIGLAMGMMTVELSYQAATVESPPQQTSVHTKKDQERIPTTLQEG